VGSPNVEHVDFAYSDGEQHTITTDNHLTNFLRELVVFWRKGKAFRHYAELFRYCCP
jgi:hypothetical protein